MHEFVFAYVLSWFPLAALVMFALFISTIVRTPERQWRWESGPCS